MIVSRHFSLLAQHDPVHHQRFLQAEKSRQRKLAGTREAMRISTGWTAALGFCDLVSLSLLSGLSRESSFRWPIRPRPRRKPRPG